MIQSIESRPRLFCVFLISIAEKAGAPHGLSATRANCSRVSDHADPHQELKLQIPEKIENAKLEPLAKNKIILFPGVKENNLQRRSKTVAKAEAMSQEAKGEIFAFPILNGPHHDYRRVK